MKVIAHIRNGFTAKFGIPRQSGLAASLQSDIVFTPEYRNPDALRGMEGFSHIWLIWEFSEAERADDGWSPTVRPPRLGGNTRMGVFATRSPFRPNPIGLSSVKIEGIELHTDEGPVIHVSGADLMNGTPIYDIKPYLPFTDSHPDAAGGFTDMTRVLDIDVEIDSGLSGRFSNEFIDEIREILSQDPRPHYHSDPKREYGMEYRGYEIRFTVSGTTLTVISIAESQNG